MKQSPKIVWCVDSPGWGGSEMNLLRVWDLLDSRYGKVILNAKVTPQVLSASIMRKFKIFHLTSPNAFVYFFPGLLKSLGVVLRFWSHTFVIWSHHPDSNRWLQLTLALLRRDFIIVEQLVPRAKSDFQKSRLSIPLKKLITGKSRKVILNGHTQTDHYRDLFGAFNAPISIIPNSRPVAAIRMKVDIHRRDRTGLRTMLDLPTGQIVICLGRLCAQKDQSSLIRALALLSAKKWRPLNLVFIGDGEDEEKLRKLVEQLELENVFFIGYQPDPLAFFADADIFVLPSLSEGLPGALIEALAAGLPCVATDVPGNRELVKHQQTGLLVPPESPKAIAEALQNLVEKPELAKHIAELGYRHVLANYDEPTEAALWKNLLNLKTTK